MMKLSMGDFIRKQFKVLYAVVIANAVYVMDNLFGLKVAADMFFHHKTVFEDVSFNISKRMFGFMNKNISVGVIFSPAFPLRIITSFKTFASSFSFFLRLRPNNPDFSTTNFSFRRFGMFKPFMRLSYSLPVCFGKMFAFRPGNLAFIRQTQLSFMFFRHLVRHIFTFWSEYSIIAAISQ